MKNMKLFLILLFLVGASDVVLAKYKERGSDSEDAVRSYYPADFIVAADDEDNRDSDNDSDEPGMEDSEEVTTPVVPRLVLPNQEYFQDVEQRLRERATWYAGVLSGRVPVNERFDSRTALHFAAENGSYEVVCRLLRMDGINVHVLDLEHQTPLYLAEVNRDEFSEVTYHGIVRALEGAGAGTMDLTNGGCDSVDKLRALRRERELDMLDMFDQDLGYGSGDSLDLDGDIGDEFNIVEQDGENMDNNVGENGPVRERNTIRLHRRRPIARPRRTQRRVFRYSHDEIRQIGRELFSDDDYSDE
ncbi:hypothetical protein KAT92_00315 [Candidatus Babeliales bacterium]|nr:hypothetical protein [Candidatus Babeliales bacterium]